MTNSSISIPVVTQQVVRLVVVHLDVGYCYFVGAAVYPLPNFRKQSTDCPWHDSPLRVFLNPARDRERFAAAGLPVRENRAVESVKRTQHRFQRHPFKHLVLTRVFGENPVKRETEPIKCVVHEQTETVVFGNLECDRVRGLCFFFEDGDEMMEWMMLLVVRLLRNTTSVLSSLPAEALVRKHFRLFRVAS